MVHNQHMELGLYLDSKVINTLNEEIAPAEMKSFIVRTIRKNADERAGTSEEIHRAIFYNAVVNAASNITQRPVYVLEDDGYGMYEPAVMAWHDGEISASIRSMSAAEIAEFSAEMVAHRYLSLNAINEVFEAFNFGARIRRPEPGKVEVEILESTDLDQRVEESAHQNIRALFARAGSNLDAGDYTGVLVAVAGALETLAKETVGTSAVAKKSMGQFKTEYKAASNLPDPVVDYMHEIFSRRNTEPTAGHGGLEEPTFTRAEAVVMLNMAKAFVACENALRDSA